MKSTNEIEGNENFDKILNEVSREEIASNAKSLQISTQILEVLENKKMLQKDFAVMMGKSEAEISKWLSGFHNFTIKTISNIEVVIGETIIVTPKQMLSNATKEISSLISRINDLDTFDNKVMTDITDIKTSPTARVVDITKVSQVKQDKFTYSLNCA